ncbi:N-acetylmuramic acid 6-phosphate etherase 1 [Striga asiatica]|uniref:N-acetylmuramic acid 6-phosphate etherase 1 n=1 Tax=Striga asiatica TaxID=4170 RepID=A0A5A7PIK1_STRAF|nr:N-acetylmuramic acid 6-phosphate etherase 1 [Striga asiatica]
MQSAPLNSSSLKIVNYTLFTGPYGSNPSTLCKPQVSLKIRSGSRAAVRAVDDISAITSSQPQITWQIVVGALAGLSPFVVAGIEFSKRIIEQKKCKVCKGSGLVLRDDKWFFAMAILEKILYWLGNQNLKTSLSPKI